MREKKNKSIKGVRGRLESFGKCPLIKNSFRECYCTNMDSLKADDAIYYCGGHYKECAIFTRKTAEFVASKTKYKHHNIR